MPRTRVKICGLTRLADVARAAAAGADAIGLVFYPESSRYASPEQAKLLACAAPPFVTRIGLFVNANAATVRQILAAVPLDVLQFHGDDALETPDYCASFGRTWLKAVRMTKTDDLLTSAARYTGAPGFQGLLLDAPAAGFGGGGKRFDWSIIPADFPLPLVLAGGLTVDNVSAAIHEVHPWAVDVSSGVETAPGHKDANKIAAFIDAVRKADERSSP